MLFTLFYNFLAFYCHSGTISCLWAYRFSITTTAVVVLFFSAVVVVVATAAIFVAATLLFFVDKHNFIVITL
jgi:hypothetical protein